MLDLKPTLERYDPFSPEVLRDPYPWYRLLRDEAPCHYVEARRLYVVSRYDDVVACAKNHRVFSSTGGVGYEWNPRPMMPMYDPPEHTRLRRLVSRPFQPNAIAERLDRIEAMVETLMARALEVRTFDLVDDFAVPLSLSVIADLLGIPQERRGDLRRWSQAIVEELPGGLDPEAKTRVDGLRREFVAYLHQMIDERRAHPDASALDVISLILAAADDDQLTEKETIAFCVLLLTAGFETTVNAIANGALALLDHPAEWEKLRADPSLVRTLAEEIVRYEGPVQSFFRNTLCDAQVAGVQIPQAHKVLVLFASANHDPRQFDAPEAFRIDRVSPQHVGYGTGVHFCLGAPLARAQLTALFGAFARRLRRFELAGPPVRTHSVLFRGAKHLPIRLEPM